MAFSIAFTKDKTYVVLLIINACSEHSSELIHMPMNTLSPIIVTVNSEASRATVDKPVLS